MPYRISGSVAVAVFACSLAATSQAQEPWPFLSLELSRYDSLVDAREDSGLPCCAPVTISAPGHVLIHLSAVIDVPWSDDLDSVSLGGADLTITVDGADPYGPAGGYLYRGVFEAEPRYVSARRPRNWPDEDADMLIEAVWAVPAGATAATVTFGEHFAIDIDIPQETGAPMSPSDTASFAVTGISDVDSIDLSLYGSGPAVAGSMSGNGGQIVQLDLEISPQMNTRLDGSSGFVYYPRYLLLVGPDGQPAFGLGRKSGGSLSNSAVTLAADSFPAGPFAESLYFLTDGAPGAYTLYFLTDAVGEIALE
ncbi:MAG: hypothetical protein ACFCVH_19655 [Alphaproteobacteria bacterium]